MATNASTIDWAQFQKQFADLRKGFASPSAATPDKTNSSGAFDINSVQGQIKATQDKLQTAQGELSNLYSTRYDEEYGSQGLGDIKTRMSDLDQKIAQEKLTRDESMSKVRKNPYYSAANITGESGEIEKLSNSRINDYIDERNGVASQYNSAIDEMTKKIAGETTQKEQEIEGLKYSLDSLNKQASDYKDTLQKELESKTNEEHWDMEFALKLQDAEQNAKEAAKTKTTDNTTADERFSQRVSQGVEPDSTLRATAQRIMDQNINDPTRLGYTGDLAVKLESEISWLKGQQPQQSQSSQKPAAAAGSTAEGTFRREVRSAWKEGYTVDQLKQIYGNIQFTDSKKTPQEVIDDEWNIKTAPGIKGFLGRLFRLGV
jgi:hypothetical protein